MRPFSLLSAKRRHRRGRHQHILRRNRRVLYGRMITCPNEISEEQCERNQHSGARNNQPADHVSGPSRSVLLGRLCSAPCSVISSMGEDESGTVKSG